MKTKVVNKYHKVDYDIYIGRGSIWGNPFSTKDSKYSVNRVDTKEEALLRYEQYILSRPELCMKLKELEGKTLACFCKPKDCHGDILVKLIENTVWESV